MWRAIILARTIIWRGDGSKSCCSIHTSVIMVVPHYFDWSKALSGTSTPNLQPEYSLSKKVFSHSPAYRGCSVSGTLNEQPHPKIHRLFATSGPKDWTSEQVHPRNFNIDAKNGDHLSIHGSFRGVTSLIKVSPHERMRPAVRVGWLEKDDLL